MNELYKKVKRLAESKAKAIYGDTLPKEVNERLAWELCSIKKNDTAKYFLAAQKLVKESGLLGFPTLLKGTAASSLVCFLLGISEPNPLPAHYICDACHYAEFHTENLNGIELENKACPICKKELIKDGFSFFPEFFMGLDGNKELYFCIGFATEIFDRINTEFQKMCIEGSNLSKIITIETIGHMSLIKKLEKITARSKKEIPHDDEATVELFKNNKLSGLPFFHSRFMQGIIDIAGVNSFDDLQRVDALSHGTDTWSFNASDLIANNIATLSEVISTREDIIRYLMSKGVEKEKAFSITDKVCKGQYYVNTKHKSTLVDREIKLMLNCGVPKWYIESCEKIQYLFPRAHSVSVTLIVYKAAYYKVHYPLEFYCTYFNLNTDKLTLDILSNDIKVLQKILEEIDTVQNDIDYTDSSTENLRHELFIKRNITETCIEMLETGLEFDCDFAKGSRIKEFVIRNGKICTIFSEEEN